MEVSPSCLGFRVYLDPQKVCRMMAFWPFEMVLDNYLPTFGAQRGLRVYGFRVFGVFRCSGFRGSGQDLDLDCGFRIQRFRV